MDQPLYWGVLAAMAAVGIAVRLATRRPLWPSRARVLTTGDLVVAAVAVAMLVFHCGAMFFADWIDVVPVAESPADAVRALGPGSQVAYWIPVAAVVFALRRVWLPALVLLMVTLVGVGYTMFVSHPLTTHLAWLAAAVLSLMLVATALVLPRRREGPVAV